MKLIFKIILFLVIVILFSTTIYFGTKKVNCPQIKTTNDSCPAAPECPNCNVNTPFRQSFLGPLINVFGVKSPLIVKNSVLVSGGNNLPNNAPESQWSYDFYNRTLKNVLTGSYLFVKDGVSVTLDSTLATRFVFKGNPNQLSLENNPTTCISWDGKNINTAGCDDKGTFFYDNGK